METSKYSLAICELFNPFIHGITKNSSPDVNGHYLIHSTFTIDEFIENEWIDLLDIMKHQYTSYPKHFKKHNLIRNYKKCITDTNYFRLNIVEVKELKGGEMVCFIKTNGLIRFQKQVKRVISEK